MTYRTIIHDAATGETEERDMTAEEAADYEIWLQENSPDNTE